MVLPSLTELEAPNRVSWSARVAKALRTGFGKASCRCEQDISVGFLGKRQSCMSPPASSTR